MLYFAISITLFSCATNGELTSDTTDNTQGSQAIEAQKNTKDTKTKSEKNISDTSENSIADSNNDLALVIGVQGVPQPDWVRSVPVSPDGVWAVGKARAYSTNIAIKEAQALTRENLLPVIQVMLQDAISTKMQMDYTKECEHISQNLLPKTRQEAYWISQSGTAFVLLLLPYSTIIEEVQNTLGTTKNSVNITQENLSIALENARKKQKGI